MATALPQAEIIRRILASPQLRTRLEADPKAFLRQEFGIQLGPGVSVRVVTATRNEVWAIVPREPGLRGAESGTVATLLQRYRTDPVWRQRVLSHPKVVYQELTGRPPPAAPTVHVVEETSTLRYLQLPAALPINAFQSAEAESDWGGGGGGWGGDPPKESSDGSCFDSMHVNCCETDFMNTQSTGGCCYPEDDTPGGGGGLPP